MCVRCFIRRMRWVLCGVAAAFVLPYYGLQASEGQIAHAQDKTVVIVAGGDLGFGGSDQPVSAMGGYRHRRLIPWKDIGKGIEPLLDGDINFANLETVVTGNARLVPADKRFRFQMHAAGARRIVEMGFNVLSTANNHARDYGQAGMRETLQSLNGLRAAGLLAFPGIARGRVAALQPVTFKVRGAYNIAISAVGIGGVDPLQESARYGQISYNRPRDFTDAVQALAQAKADYRILSVHYGAELQIRPSANDIQKLRDRAVREAGVDLVLGHHAHVAAGVQAVEGRLIFYGLGNLLHFGMQNMAKFDVCRDFGLMARIYLSQNQDGGLKARAVKVIPLADMHENAHPMAPLEAHKRIAVINGLADQLSDAESGAKGLKFVPQADGTGLYCFAAADNADGKIAGLCKDWANAGHDNRAVFPVHNCRSVRVSMSATKKRQVNQVNKVKSNFVKDYFARTYNH